MSNGFYQEHAEELAQQYLSKSFDEIHQSWSQYLSPVMKNPHARILDVGAGAGRDVKHLAQLAERTHQQANDIQITAVEPVEALAEIGRQHTYGQRVSWVQDSLPALAHISAQESRFDLILLSAVWMHIPLGQQARSLRKLANLLKPGGKLVISLRYGQTDQECQQRGMFTICGKELQKLATDFGLSTILATPIEPDKLQRAHINWQTLVLEAPDKGDLSLPFIRHLIKNDNKSGTHKLGLLRVLLRIADGLPSAATRSYAKIKKISQQNENTVHLPLGLVALYWCKQYKPLLDTYQLKQQNNPNTNMGFQKSSGWDQLKDWHHSDYAIGNSFNSDDAKALCKTFNDVIKNIREMPCKYITYPNSDIPVFHIFSNTKPTQGLTFMDLPSLQQWGEFVMPESIWLALTQHGCWIEPVLISEWVKVMAANKGNQQYAAAEQQHHLFQALQWLEPNRCTAKVRERLEALTGWKNAHCTWTGSKLKSSYHIDHILPFAHWPNNDLWNLIPCSAAVNGKKKDKLPSQQKCEDAKQRIQNWWQNAWLEQDENTQKRFFAEANAALPGLTPDNNSLDNIYQALLLQRNRLRDLQQLQEW